MFVLSPRRFLGGLNERLQAAHVRPLLAVTSLLPLFVVPWVPFLVLFCVMAAMNHVVPTGRGSQLLKAVFVPVAMRGAPWWAQAVAVGATGVGGGGPLRQGWMLYSVVQGLVDGRIGWWMAALMGAFKLVYAAERRARIRRGDRNAFGPWHAAEHLDVALYVAATTLEPAHHGAAAMMLVGMTLTTWAQCTHVPVLAGPGMCLFIPGHEYPARHLLFTLGSNAVFWWNAPHHAVPTALWCVGTLLPSEGMRALEGVVLAWSGGAPYAVLWMVATILLNQRPALGWGALVVATGAVRYDGMPVYGWLVLCLGLFGRIVSVHAKPTCVHFDLTVRMTIALLGTHVVGDMLPCAIVSGIGLVWYGRSYWSHRDDPDVPSALRAVWRDKLASNAFSLSIIGAVAKIASPVLTHESYTLRDLHASTDAAYTRLRVVPDLVVGLTTGGAFVAARYAARANCEVAFLKSRVWSGNSLWENTLAWVHLLRGDFVQQTPRVLHWYDRPPSGTDPAHVLLVDDTISTGRTMLHAKAFLVQTFPAARVETLVWRAPTTNAADYVMECADVPVFCPWGFEID